MSRGAVEDAALPQTPQESDAIDKKYGIWQDVFLDSVDVHVRARRRNLYGPVSFAFDIAVLGASEIPFVWISRRNPVHWRPGEPDENRYYSSVQEFESEFQYGDFFKHIMVRDRPWISLSGLNRVVLDDPGFDPPTLVNEAMAALQRAAAAGGAVLPGQVQQRHCGTCQCAEQYARLNGFETRLFAE